MGNLLLDQFTYLHFSVGIMSYFWGISILNLFIVHTIFEILENSSFGMNIINNYMPFWPGGKPKSDSVINVIGDTFGALFGWLSAYYLDKKGNEYGWYNLHIK